MNKTCVKILLVTLIFLNSLTLFAVTPQRPSPTVKIKVAQYERFIDFVLPEGGKWFSGDKSGAIPAGKKCRIEGKLTKPALKNFHLMVGSAHAADEKKHKEVLERFTAKGFKTHSFMVGRLPTKGFPDNRINFIGIGIYPIEAEAQKQLDRLAAENISSWVFVETLRPSEGKLKLKVGKKSITLNDPGIKLEGKKGVQLLKAEYAKGYSWHGFADRTYKSSIQVLWGSNDSLDCIEHTDLESLLVGIVPSEISSKAADGALQAQATAARGEMLAKFGTRHFNQGYDFCSEQHCQVYKGIQSCDEQISKAIKNTRGFVLLTSESGALDAVYSANCGGHSSANQNIWTSNANPHLQGVPDTISPQKLDLTDENKVKDYIRNPPACWCGIGGVEGSDKFRWKKELGGKKWKKIEENIGLGRIKSVDSFVRDVSGRIYSLKITGENGEKTIMKELTIRRLFDGLRSSCFIANWYRNKLKFIEGVKFEGAGWGHGVGMCQTGVQSMAAKGKPFQEILLHYFPGALLKKLY